VHFFCSIAEITEKTDVHSLYKVKNQLNLRVKKIRINQNFEYFCANVYIRGVLATQLLPGIINKNTVHGT
jgi:hypothetical protein